MENTELINEINKIKLISTKKIAGVLDLGVRQSNKFKTGESELKLSQALSLQEELGLYPPAFEEIRKEYLENKDKK